MAFIDTSDEIKKHNSAVNANIELINVESFIDEAINTQLIPGIGRDQFDALVAGKSGYASGSKELTVFNLLQKAGVNFMLGFFTDSGALVISNTGISVTKGTTTMPASDTKLMNFKEKCLRDGFNNLELAIIFLESNIADFALYAASDERKANRALLINTSAEFQASGVNIGSSAQLYKTLRIYQESVEDNSIAPVLGADFYESIKVLALAGGASAKQSTLITQVRKAIAFLTMLEAIPYMAVSLDPSGVFQLSKGGSTSIESKDPAAINRLQIAMGQYCNRANTQINTITEFLKANTADFPLYALPDSVNINDGSAPNVYAFL